MTTITGTIEWTEQNVQMSETWANESTVTIDGTEWTVLFDGANATSFTLQQPLDRQAILENDPNAANETVTSGGQEYVVVQSNGGEELVLINEYFPEPTTQTYSVGDQFVYNNQTVTANEITADGVNITWIQDQTKTKEITHEGTIELADGNQYLTFLPDSSTLQLTSDMTSYNQQVEAQNQFHDRTSGFRWVTFTSLLFVFSLIAFAFLPSRY